MSGKTRKFRKRKEAEEEEKEWFRKLKSAERISYKKLMASDEIKKHKERKTVDISGMGGTYEYTCQEMLEIGIAWLKEHPDYKFEDVEEGEPIRKSKMRDVLLTANNDMYGITGAQMGAVLQHLVTISVHGVEGWLELYPEDRTYTFPTELPPPNL